MKNTIKLFTAFFAVALIFNSCSTDDKTIDTVLDDVTNGAVLRGDDDTLIDEMILDIAPAMFYVDIQEQDVEDGALLESVDVFVTFKDNSEIAGDSSPANLDEVFAFNIPASEFTTGEFGLPATSINIPLAQLLSLVNLSNDQEIYVDDTFTIRLALKLTDGRVFSVEETANVVTGGFFNSPFQYIFTVSGGLDLVFTEEGTNEINLGAGATNDGYSADVSVSEAVEDLWTSVEVYARYVDNNNDEEDEEDVDYTTEESLIGTFDRSLFSENEGTEEDLTDLIASLSFTLDEISSGVAIENMTVGDAVELRYAIINNAGRSISSLTIPFVQTVPVVSCPVAPLDNSNLFIGEYTVEHLTPSIFGYQTFGEGQVLTLYSDVTDDSQNSPGVTLASNERAFDAVYLFDFGTGEYTTWVMDFNCTSVTFVDGSAPIGDFTGLQCGGVSIITGSAPGAGNFDVTDDSEFILSFTDDFTDACGTDPAQPTIKFIKN